jgi:hypothetical protein
MYFSWNCRIYFNSKACGACSILPSIKGLILKCTELQACVCKRGFTGRVKNLVSDSPVCLHITTKVRNEDYRHIDPAIFRTEALTSRLIPWNTTLHQKPFSRSWNLLSLPNPNAHCSYYKSQMVLTIISCFFETSSHLVQVSQAVSPFRGSIPICHVPSISSS